MAITELLSPFQSAATHPREQLQEHLGAGTPVVLAAPVYAPSEIIHSMGLAPMGAWGADVSIDQARRYFPTFICSIVQSIVELGMRGTYDGASALVVPSLCDSLKVLGENWKYAVPQIPFVPMVYPQNRRNGAAEAFTIASYERVIDDLSRITGAIFWPGALDASIDAYDRHNAVMRRLAEVLAGHPEVTPLQRSAVYKSAWFLPVEEHTALVQQLLDELSSPVDTTGRRLRVVTSGILCDSPNLLGALDELGFQVVSDDVAAESRQYATDAPPGDDPLVRLARKHRDRTNCSVLFDVAKPRARHIVDLARRRDADAVIVALTKFCDPEEFDVPLIKKTCREADLPVLVLEVDRQTVDYEQARTALTAFAEVLA